jgi:hypothetical protein
MNIQIVFCILNFDIEFPLLFAAGCHTRLDVQHISRRSFSRTQKPSEDITRLLFLMKMKGLSYVIIDLYVKCIRKMQKTSMKKMAYPQ